MYLLAPTPECSVLTGGTRLGMLRARMSQLPAHVFQQAPGRLPGCVHLSAMIYSTAFAPWCASHMCCTSAIVLVWPSVQRHGWGWIGYGFQVFCQRNIDGLESNVMGGAAIRAWFGQRAYHHLQNWKHIHDGGHVLLIYLWCLVVPDTTPGGVIQ